MGVKTFTDGDFLTATDLNVYCLNQYGKTQTAISAQTPMGAFQQPLGTVVTQGSGTTNRFQSMVVAFLWATVQTGETGTASTAGFQLPYAAAGPYHRPLIGNFYLYDTSLAAGYRATPYLWDAWTVIGVNGTQILGGGAALAVGDYAEANFMYEAET